jgi:hypothetical protein
VENQVLSWLLRQCFVKLCRTELSPRIEAQQFRRLTRQATRRHRQLLSSLPREQTFGARLVIKFIAPGIAFFHAIEAAGVDRAEAVHIIARSNQRLLKPLLRVAALFACLLGRRAISRSRRIWAGLNKFFPFAPPAWKRVDVAAGPDGFGFDYSSCPIAATCREQNALDLCSGAFCAADYWIGDALKVHLERTETLALGHARCRFRWQAIDPGNPRPGNAGSQ